MAKDTPCALSQYPDSENEKQPFTTSTPIPIKTPSIPTKNQSKPVSESVQPESFFFNPVKAERAERKKEAANNILMWANKTKKEVVKQEDPLASSDDKTKEPKKGENLTSSDVDIKEPEQSFDGESPDDRTPFPFDY